MRPLLAILFLLSLAAAASEGPYFPWPNVVGAVVLVMFGRMAGRLT
jgi:predicted small lipoprotein YifL